MCWYGNWLINCSGCQRPNSHSNHQPASQNVDVKQLCDEATEVYYFWCVDILLVTAQHIDAVAVDDNGLWVFTERGEILCSSIRMK